MFQYIRDGRCFGPVSANELMQLLETRMLDEEDLVRLDGVSSWRPAHEVVVDLLAGRIDEADLAKARRNSAGPPGASKVMGSAPPPPPDMLPRVGAKRCSRCATEMRADARFCKQCGARLPEPLCEACGRLNDFDAVFCDGCGRELGSPP